MSRHVPRLRHRTMLWMSILLLAASPLSHALECFERSPSVRAGKDVFDAISPTRLTSEDRKSVDRFFRLLQGRWRGKTDGYFCRGTRDAIRKEKDDYRVELKATRDGTDELSLVSSLESTDAKTSRTETLRLYLSEDALRLDRDDRGSGVEILSLSSTGGEIAFLHKVFDRSAAGGVTVTEFLRRFHVSTTRLEIEYQVYLAGVLSSASTWVLSRK